MRRARRSDGLCATRNAMGKKTENYASVCGRIMNRDQAIGIVKRLTEVDRTLRGAERAVAGLGKVDRLRFDDLLNEVIAALHEGVLAELYKQHPDLEPPTLNDEDDSHVDSEWRWDQVRLPPPLTEAEFDKVILSTLGPHWRKVAAIVTRVVDKYENTHPAITYEVVAARLHALSEADIIEGIGDLRMWRYSEVRLKD